MSKKNGIVSVVVLLALCLALTGTGWAQRDGATIYRVESLPLEEGNIALLYEMLGIPEAPLQRKGEAQFLDPEGYEWLPMMQVDAPTANEDRMDVVPLGFNIAGIQSLQAVDAEEALLRFEGALAEAGLHPGDVLGEAGYETSVDYSIFQVVDLEGGDIVTAKLDAHVLFDFNLEGVPYLGPGMQVRASFHPEMGATALSYAVRRVYADDWVPILSEDEAAELYWKHLGDIAGDVRLNVDLVYYAPSLEYREAVYILPHYRISGVAVIQGQPIELPETFMPAVREDEGLIPVIEGIGLERIDDRTYQAFVPIRGGFGSYTVDLAVEVSLIEYYEVNETRGGVTVTFGLIPGIANRFGGDSYMDWLTVGVTDRNGIRAVASERFEAAALAPQITLAATRFALIPGRVDAGTEYTGVCEGLPNTAANGAGFANVFRGRGITVAFEWGGFNAWERDYVDSRKRGDGIDSDYIDNVDIAFHSSHGNSSGFTFCSSQASTFMHYSRALWGDRDIEWLAIDACSVLAKSSGANAWYKRWGPAFDGLHLFLSFEGVNYDTTVEGRRFAENLFGLYYWFPLPVRSAWTSMCIRTHGSNVRYAVMGVIGPQGLSNYNDYFWGQGPVGPDIRGSNIRGWWLLTGPC